MWVLFSLLKKDKNRTGKSGDLSITLPEWGASPGHAQKI